MKCTPRCGGDDLIALALNNPSTPSKTCCSEPGRSTESHERSIRNNSSRKAKTRISIASEFGMGAVGCLGSIFIVRSNDVTGPANIRFKISVNHNCSGIKSLPTASSWLRIFKSHEFRSCIQL